MSTPYTRAERRFDAAVHILGVGGALVAAPLLLTLAIQAGDATRIATAAVYVLGLVTMLGLSAAYHTCRCPRRKARLRPFDHAAIYLMIAGTYTPLSLIAIGGWLGATLLAAVWTAAVVGIILKLLRPEDFEKTSLVLYLAMGWCGGIAVLPLAESLHPEALALLAAGGLAYTAGVPVHLAKFKYQNALWHVCVLLGAACHFGTITYSVAGA